VSQGRCGTIAPANSEKRREQHNADAHLERQTIGREVVVAITKGKLDLGLAGESLSRPMKSSAARNL